MDNFINLHNHSVYSVWDGINTPEQLVGQAAKLKQQAISLTDHGFLGGLFKLKQASKKFGVKPIFGIENYCVQNLVEEEGKKRLKTKNAHVILLAKNDKGYKNLLYLNYLANSDTNHYYYKPRNSFKELFDNHTGIIVGTACIASGFANLLKQDKYEEAEQLFIKFTEVFKDDMFAELQINELEEQKRYNSWLINQANKHGVPLVLTADAHYIDSSGAAIQEYSFQLRNEDDKEVGEQFNCHYLFLHTTEDFKKHNEIFNYGYTNQQIELWCRQSVDIANKTNFLLPTHNTMILPRQAFDEDEQIMELIKEGMIKHFKVSSYEDVPQEYRDRIKKELQLIIQKGIARYLLMLWDIFQFIEKEGILKSSARGSAGGSLCLCALGVIGWQMDPLQTDLIFERFVSSQRLVDMVCDYYGED